MKMQQSRTILIRMMMISTMTAACILLIGGVLFLIQHSSEPIVAYIFKSEQVFNKTESTNLTSVSGILKGILQGKVESLIQLGVLLLILNPFLRVCFAGYAFLKEKNTLYVLISLIVFLILCVSLMI